MFSFLSLSFVLAHIVYASNGVVDNETANSKSNVPSTISISTLTLLPTQSRREVNDYQNLSHFEQSERDGVLNEELGLYNYPDKWWLTIATAKDAASRQPLQQYNKVQLARAPGKPFDRNITPTNETLIDKNKLNNDKIKLRAAEKVLDKLINLHGLSNRVSIDDNLKRIVAKADKLKEGNKSNFRGHDFLRANSRETLNKINQYLKNTSATDILNSYINDHIFNKTDSHPRNIAVRANNHKYEKLRKNSNKKRPRNHEDFHRKNVNPTNGGQNHSINLSYNKVIETTQLNVSGNSVNYAEAIKIADKVMNYLTQRPKDSVPSVVSVLPGPRHGPEVAKEVRTTTDEQSHLWVGVGWTTVHPNEFMKVMMKKLMTLKMGYFSISLIHMSSTLYAKPDDVFHRLCSAVEEEYKTLLNEDKILVSFGPEFQKAFETFAKNLKSLPSDYVKSQAIILHHAIIHRRTYLSDDLNSLMDYVDTLYLDQEGMDLFKVVDKLQNDPGSLDNPQEALRTISRAVFAPYVRLEGSNKRQILTDFLEKAVKKFVFDGFDDDYILRRAFSVKTRFSVIGREGHASNENAHANLTTSSHKTNAPYNTYYGGSLDSTTRKYHSNNKKEHKEIFEDTMTKIISSPEMFHRGLNVEKTVKPTKWKYKHQKHVHDSKRYPEAHKKYVDKKINLQEKHLRDDHDIHLHNANNTRLNSNHEKHLHLKANKRNKQSFNQHKDKGFSALNNNDSEYNELYTSETESDKLALISGSKHKIVNAKAKNNNAIYKKSDYDTGTHKYDPETEENHEAQESQNNLKNKNYTHFKNSVEVNEASEKKLESEDIITDKTTKTDYRGKALMSKIDQLSDYKDINLSNSKLQTRNKKITTNSNSKIIIHPKNKKNYKSNHKAKEITTEPWAPLGANIDFKEYDYYRDDTDDSKYSESEIKKKTRRPISEKFDLTQLNTRYSITTKKIRKPNITYEINVLKNKTHKNRTKPHKVRINLYPKAKLEDNIKNTNTKDEFENEKITNTTRSLSHKQFGVDKKLKHVNNRNDNSYHKYKTNSKKVVFDYGPIAIKVYSKTHIPSRNFYPKKARAQRSDKKEIHHKFHENQPRNTSYKEDNRFNKMNVKRNKNNNINYKPKSGYFHFKKQRNEPKKAQTLNKEIQDNINKDTSIDTGEDTTERDLRQNSFNENETMTSKKTQLFTEDRRETTKPIKSKLFYDFSNTRQNTKQSLSSTKYRAKLNNPRIHFFDIDDFSYSFSSSEKNPEKLQAKTNALNGSFLGNRTKWKSEETNSNNFISKPTSLLATRKKAFNIKEPYKGLNVASAKFNQRQRATSDNAENFSADEKDPKNKITDLTSYSDEEESLKYHLDDAMRHGGRNFKPARRHNDNENNDTHYRRVNRFSSYSNEEFVLKSNIYKVLGFDNFSSSNNIVKRDKPKFNRRKKQLFNKLSG